MKIEYRTWEHGGFSGKRDHLSLVSITEKIVLPGAVCFNGQWFTLAPMDKAADLKKQWAVAVKTNAG
ncbi:MAG: hypothetical protein ABI615_07420 [Chthoniobacterales bacterium]